jgi:hypothetical protein
MEFIITHGLEMKTRRAGKARRAERDAYAAMRSRQGGVADATDQTAVPLLVAERETPYRQVVKSENSRMLRGRIMNEDPKMSSADLEAIQRRTAPSELVLHADARRQGVEVDFDEGRLFARVFYGC